MGPQFFQTNMGIKFFEGDVPAFIEAIQKHTEALNKQTEALNRQSQLVEKLLEKMDGTGISDGTAQ